MQTVTSRPYLVLAREDHAVLGAPDSGILPSMKRALLAAANCLHLGLHVEKSKVSDVVPPIIG